MAALPFLAHWRNSVRDNPRLNTTTKAVAFVLSTYMDSRGFAFPSKGTLADGAGASLRTVDAAVANLEDAQFLLIRKSRGRISWRYTATIPTNDATVATLGIQPGNLDGPTTQLTAATWQQLRTKAFESESESGRPEAGTETGVCTECEIGGGHHSWDCSRASTDDDLGPDF